MKSMHYSTKPHWESNKYKLPEPSFSALASVKKKLLAYVLIPIRISALHLMKTNVCNNTGITALTGRHVNLLCVQQTSVTYKEPSSPKCLNRDCKGFAKLNMTRC